MTAATTPPAVPDLLGTAPADLIDKWEAPPAPATRDVAVRRAERIRAGVVSYAAMRQDIADAYAQRDWAALEYDSWHAYLEGEFGDELRQLARIPKERKAAVADLRGQGMSTRQIATATGVTQTQVVRDLKQVNTEVSPDAITGRDGKTYPASKPAKKAPPAAAGGEPEHEQVSAWGGIRGECGAACACGTTFDNFDTLAEAIALLDQHIADAAQAPAAEPTPVRRPDAGEAPTAAAPGVSSAASSPAGPDAQGPGGEPGSDTTGGARPGRPGDRLAVARAWQQSLGQELDVVARVVDIDPQEFIDFASDAQMRELEDLHARLGRLVDAVKAARAQT